MLFPHQALRIGMSTPHVIRLRGPWEYCPLERVRLLHDGTCERSSQGLPPGGRVEIPADWGQTLGDDFRGRVRYVRRFGCPTNLTSGDRVWLVLEAVDARAEVMLNDEPLGSVTGPAGGRFDITAALRDRNVLTVDVELLPLPSEVERERRAERAGGPGGLIGEVRLEIAAR